MSVSSSGTVTPTTCSSLMSDVKVSRTDPSSVSQPGYGTMRYICCARKGGTFADLRTVLEADGVMKPEEVFVLGRNELSTPSYEKHRSWEQCSTVIVPQRLFLFQCRS